MAEYVSGSPAVGALLIAVLRLLGAGVVAAAAVIARATEGSTLLALAAAGLGAAISFLGPIALKGVEQKSRRRREQEAILDELLPRPPIAVEEVDPYDDLGIPRSVIAERHQEGRKYPPYVFRTVGIKVEKALRDGDFVLIYGPRAAGKSRLAYESLLRTFPKKLIVVPDRGKTGSDLLRDIVSNLSRDQLTKMIFWLDDIEQYLKTQALDQPTLVRLRKRGATVIGTIRSSDLEQVRQLTRLSASSDPDGVSPSEMSRVLDAASQFRLDSRPGDSNEQSEAASLYPGEDFSVGIGARLIGGPRVIERFEVGRDRFQAGAVVACATADWRRSSIDRPLPRRVLEELYPVYRAPGEDFAQELDRGVEWAQEEVLPGVSLVSRRGGPQEGLNPYDYLVAYRDGEVGEGRGGCAIPIKAWSVISKHVQPEEALSVAYTAFARGSRSTALKVLEIATEPNIPGFPQALLLRASIELDAGELQKGMASLKAVVETADPTAAASAAYQLGRIYEAQDNPLESRTVFEIAARSNNPEEAGQAALRLARLVDDDASKQLWYERAIGAHAQGSGLLASIAASELVEHLKSRGLADKIPAALDRAISLTVSDDSDSGLNLLNLASQLSLREYWDQAVTAYGLILQRSDQALHPNALYELGRIERWRGNRRQARSLFKKSLAMDTDFYFSVLSALELGEMCRGPWGEANRERIYMRVLFKAQARNDAHGMKTALELGSRLKELGARRLAKRAYKVVLGIRSIEGREHAAHAAESLGRLAAEENEWERAAEMWRRAIQEDPDASPYAIVSLKQMLDSQGKHQEASDEYAEWMRLVDTRSVLETAGRAFSDAGNAGDAKRAYERAITLPFVGERYCKAEIDLARIARQEGDVRRAQSLLRYAIGLATYRPAVADAALLLGQIHEDRDEFEAAIAEYRRAAAVLFEYGPGGEAHLRLAGALCKASRESEALDAYESVIDAAHPRFVKEAIREYLYLTPRLGQSGRADEFFKRLWVTGDADVRARRALAIADVAERIGNSQLRESALLVALDSGSPVYAGEAALLLAGGGLEVPPEASYAAALQSDDQKILAWSHIGFAIWAMDAGDPDRALAALRSGLVCGFEAVTPWAALFQAGVFEDLGKTAQARVALEIAASSGDHPAAEPAREALSGQISG